MCCHLTTAASPCGMQLLWQLSLLLRYFLRDSLWLGFPGLGVPLSLHSANTQINTCNDLKQHQVDKNKMIKKQKRQVTLLNRLQSPSLLTRIINPLRVLDELSQSTAVTPVSNRFGRTHHNHLAFLVLHRWLQYQHLKSAVILLFLVLLHRYRHFFSTTKAALIQSLCSTTAILLALEGHLYCGFCYLLLRWQHFVSAQRPPFWNRAFFFLHLLADLER